jgi:predicted DNA-binding protein
MKEQDISHSRKGRKIKKLGSGHLSAVDTVEAERIEAADFRENGVRCTFRWGEEQLRLVKLVADKIGIPYQTYMKEAIFRQCMQDVQRFGMVDADQEMSYVNLRELPTNIVQEQAVDTFGTSASKKVLLAIPSAMLDQVDLISKHEHRTRSDLLREAVSRYIARQRDQLW